jgi:uncharacterized protein (DUF58 family)
VNKLSITKRFVFLLVLGIVVLAGSLFIGNSLTIFIIYNLTCFILLLTDYFISPKETEIEVTRNENDKLSIFEKEAMGFTVYNKSEYKINIELIDEIPEFHFEIENKVMKGKIAPGKKETFQYTVFPTKRGAYEFKAVHIRYEGRLMFCKRQYKIPLNKEYRVYPNLKNLRRYRLNLTNNRNLRQGQRNMQMLGKGTSFESLREYVLGDEYRKINWQATARENKPIVNQYEPEKNQHVYLFVDTGRPMSYTVRGQRKLDLAVNTALVLSDIVNQNGDQSALLLFNRMVNNMIAPGKGAGHRNKMMEALYHIDYTNETSNYDDAFYYFKKKERHRSLIFLFTDFETLEEAENMLRVLPIISKNNLVVIILIKNESLGEIGLQRIKNQKQMFDKGVAIELLEERKRIISILNKRGVLCMECPSEKIELTAINKYIQIKNKSYY